jgi:membrane dipeptidase
LDKGQTPGAILSIEGGDALMGKADLVNKFHDMGVRIITIAHYTVNELGDIMTAPPKHNGLTEAGKSVVERMQSLGVVVDVAHAHTETMKQIVAMAAKPVIDSHTSLCYDETRYGRRRTWKEMELVARTDGLVCTWPLSYDRRKTFHDWAMELLEMKKRLGIRHVGLGTDDGGRLPAMVSGYHDTRDLGHLIKAMETVGFDQDDITAILSGNLMKVLKECIG